MRILYLTGLHPVETNPSSGIFITRRIKKLQEHGIDCDLYFFAENMGLCARLLKCFFKRPSFKEKRTVRVDGVQYKPLTVDFSVWDMIFYHQRIGRLLFKAVVAQLDLKSYDLVHAHWVYPHGYIAALIKREIGIPCVVSAHGSDIHTNPWKNPGSIPAVTFTLKFADRVIFNNFKLLETAMKLGCDDLNHVVIPNGIDTGIFVVRDKCLIRAELGLSSLKGNIVGFVGSLKAVKRADRLPDIFRAIYSQSQNTRFIIIGSGKLRKVIEKRCKQYRLDVRFIGNTAPDQIPKWMSALDVLVLPSRKEGFPNVCLEAQACGCPVVGSNAGGIPEAVGSGGLIVEDTGNDFENSFSKAVLQLLDNPPPAEKLRTRAQQFEWDWVIGKQIVVYEELLQGKER